MIIFKRNIVLLPTNFDGKIKGKGVLSILKEDDGTSCKLKCYNMPPFTGKVLLGVMVQDNIHKFDITQKANDFKFEIHDDNIDEKAKISCAIINIIDKQYNTVIWGSSEISKAYKQTISNILGKEYEPVKNTLIQDNTNIKKQSDFYSAVNNIVKDFEENKLKYPQSDQFSYLNEVKKDGYRDGQLGNYDFDADSEDEKNLGEVVDKEVLKEFEDDIIEESDEDEYFLEKDIDDAIEKQSKSTQVFSNKPFDYEQIKDNDTVGNFYSLISDQVEKMLKENQNEKILEEIIPDSIFVRIDGNSETYNVFGVIYQDGRIKYICYGTYATYGNPPADNPKAYYQWLPVDVDNPYNEGYYMMYQDADTGENIEMQVI